MADRDPWYDTPRPRLYGDPETAWHGRDRRPAAYPEDDFDDDERRAYRREARAFGPPGAHRRYGAADYEQRSAPDDRAYAAYGRRGGWPAYDPGRDSPAWRDASASMWRGEFTYDYDFDRRERGFWDRARDEVATWFGDRRAEMRRRADGAHRGKGPSGYRRADERIHDDVNDRLTDDPWLDATEIEVKVKGGEVTLDGKVATRHDKRRAEDLAEAVLGVTHVQNNLRPESLERQVLHREFFSPLP